MLKILAADDCMFSCGGSIFDRSFGMIGHKCQVPPRDHLLRCLRSEKLRKFSPTKEFRFLTLLYTSTARQGISNSVFFKRLTATPSRTLCINCELHCIHEHTTNVKRHSFFMQLEPESSACAKSSQPINLEKDEHFHSETSSNDGFRSNRIPVAHWSGD